LTVKEMKTKELVDTQEIFEGVTDLGDRMRRGVGHGIDYAENLANDGQVSSDEYAADQLRYGMESIICESGHIAVESTKLPKRFPYEKVLQRIPNVPKCTRVSQQPQTAVRQTFRYTGKNTIKTFQKATRATTKKAQVGVKNARVAARTTRRTAELLREAAKVTAEAAKVTAKAIAAAVKAAATAIEELAKAIVAGGWIVLVIIAVMIIIFVIIIAVVGYLEPSIMPPE